MYLLDTDTCIYIIKEKPESVLSYFQKIDVGHISISSITLSELVFGAEKSGNPKKNLNALEKFVMPLEILPYKASTAYTYGKIRNDLEAKGIPIGPMDTLIAAHALDYDCTLVTNNEREFTRVPELKIENWAN